MQYTHKNPPQKLRQVEKDRIDGLRHSTTPKSPRGPALTTLACDTPAKVVYGCSQNSTISAKNQSLSQKTIRAKVAYGCSRNSTISAKNQSLFQKTIRAKVAYGCSRNSTTSEKNQSLSQKTIRAKVAYGCSRNGTTSAKDRSLFQKTPRKSRLRVQPE
jgi:ABC-type thiamine transport system substrate-binding protein